MLHGTIGDINVEIADLNLDGKVDEEDAQILNRYLSGDETDLLEFYKKVYGETPWNIIVKPEYAPNKLYVIRRFDYSIFDFIVSDGNDTAYYRTAMVIK